MSKLLTKKDIVDIVRIKLPLVVEAFNVANLEAQSVKPDLEKLKELLNSDHIDGFYDISDLLEAYHKLLKETS